MAEGARLESVYTVTPYRGFESLSLRQLPSPHNLPGYLKRQPTRHTLKREGSNPKEWFDDERSSVDGAQRRPKGEETP